MKARDLRKKFGVVALSLCVGGAVGYWGRGLFAPTLSPPPDAECWQPLSLANISDKPSAEFIAAVPAFVQGLADILGGTPTVFIEGKVLREAVGAYFKKKGISGIKDIPDNERKSAIEDLTQIIRKTIRKEGMPFVEGPPTIAGQTNVSSDAILSAVADAFHPVDSLYLTDPKRLEGPAMAVSLGVSSSLSGLIVLNTGSSLVKAGNTLTDAVVSGMRIDSQPLGDYLAGVSLLWKDAPYAISLATLLHEAFHIDDPWIWTNNRKDRSAWDDGTVPVADLLSIRKGTRIELSLASELRCDHGMAKMVMKVDPLIGKRILNYFVVLRDLFLLTDYQHATAPLLRSVLEGHDERVNYESVGVTIARTVDSMYRPWEALLKTNPPTAHVIEVILAHGLADQKIEFIRLHTDGEAHRLLEAHDRARKDVLLHEALKKVTAQPDLQVQLRRPECAPRSQSAGSGAKVAPAPGG